MDYTPVSVTHLSLKVIYGIKARVFLTQQDYVSAAHYASLAIRKAESEGFCLMQGEECLNGFSKIISRSREALWAANTRMIRQLLSFRFMLLCPGILILQPFGWLPVASIPCFLLHFLLRISVVGGGIRQEN